MGRSVHALADLLSATVIPYFMTQKDNASEKHLKLTDKALGLLSWHLSENRTWNPQGRGRNASR